MKLKYILAGLAIVFILSTAAVAGDAGKPALVYATAPQGREILTTQDDFINALSPFDREIRMRSEKPVSRKDFLEFISNNVLDWNKEDKDGLQIIVNSMDLKLARYASLLPDKIYLIKTTGNEEGNSAYTRGHAIIIPQRIMAMNPVEMYRLMSHEIFHIMARRNKKMAEELYAAIGFHTCPDFTLPGNLEKRRLTNPDAPVNNHCITVTIGKNHYDVVPFLYSNVDSYSRHHGEELFDYLQAGFLSVAKVNKSGSRPVILKEKDVKIYKEEDLKGFFEKVGKNTDYTIQPEEILADNFSYIFFDMTEVESPEILKRIKKILDRYISNSAG